MDLFILVGLFFAVIIASVLSVLSGGAGLIMTPLLILAGVPPITAVASYRVATVGSLLTTLIKFHKHKKINYKLALPLTVFSLGGAYFATQVVLTINQNLLKRIISAIILFVLILLVLNKNLGVKPNKNKFKPHLKWIVGSISSFLISFLNILIGGGGEHYIHT